MAKSKQRAIAAKGGKAAHLKGTAYEWDRAAAKAAGQKGGHMSRGGRGKLPEGTDTPEGTGTSTGTVRTEGGLPTAAQHTVEAPQTAPSAEGEGRPTRPQAEPAEQ